jgi:anti-sigma B factor antagonist
MRVYKGLGQLMKSGLSISEATVEGIHVLRLAGFLDGHTFMDLERKIDALIKSGRVRLVMDLSGLTYIASAGVGLFIASLGQAKKSQGRIELANAGPSIKEIFDILGLDAIFTIHANLPAAVKAARA